MDAWMNVGRKLTCFALFMNSAAAKRMNAIASAVRRSEKARFLFITDGLIGEKFSNSVREKDGNDEEIIRRERKGSSMYTYMSITVNMNQTMRYKPTAFDNSCVLLP